MNFGLLSNSFSFLYPMALWAAPLAFAALIYAYLRRGTAKQIIVSSTFLLRHLKRQSRARRKFIPPLRFFFDLLLLALLILAASGLFSNKHGQLIAIIIDNSLSMAHVDAAESDNLLADANSEAGSILSAFPSETRVRLFSSSPSLKSIQANDDYSENADLTPRRASSLLKNIKITYAADRLESALANLANKPFDRIIVLTDRTAQLTEKGVPELRTIQNIEVKTIKSRNTNHSNIAISNVALNFDTLRPAQSNLRVDLTLFDRQDRKADVILESFELDGKFSSVAKREVALKTNASESVVFQDLPSTARAYRVRIDNTATGDSTKADLLPQDNSAFISRQGDQAKMLLVSKFSPQELGLVKIPGLVWTAVLPENYLDSMLQDSAAVVFHRFVPDKLPVAPSLFIAPPLGIISQETFSQSAPIEPASSPELTSWSETHPLLQYISLSALTLKQLIPIKTPTWAETIINSSAGAVLIAGEYGKARHVASGFELLPFVGQTEPTLSIILLNILRWLNDQPLQLGYVSTHSVLDIKPDVESARYIDDASGWPAKLTLEKPGLVEIGGVETQDSKILAVNFFDPDESNISNLPKLVVPERGQTSPAPLQNNDLAHSLLSLVIALVLIDMLISLLRTFHLMPITSVLQNRAA